MKLKLHAIGLVGAVAFLASACQQMEEMMGQQAESAPRPSAMASDTVTARATVIAVNRPEREVVLRKEDGTVMGYILDDSVRNFDQIEVGDVVTARYYEAVAVSVQPSTGEPTVTSSNSLESAPLGDKPGAMATRVSDLTARVEDIDYASRMVTLRGPGGRVEKMKVGPEVKNLEAVRRGDDVLVRHTEAVAVAVTE